MYRSLYITNPVLPSAESNTSLRVQHVGKAGPPVHVDFRKARRPEIFVHGRQIQARNVADLHLNGHYLDLQNDRVKFRLEACVEMRHDCYGPRESP